MKDRQSTYPGRVTMKPVPDAENTYDMTLADVPIQEGTALNKKNLLSDSTATLLDLNEDATPNDALVEIIHRLSEAQSSLKTVQGKVSDLIRSGTEDIGVGAPLPTGTVYLVYK